MKSVLNLMNKKSEITAYSQVEVESELLNNVSDFSDDEEPDCELIQVSKTIVKYVLRDQELKDNLNKEAKLFNQLRSRLTGVDGVRSIEVFKCKETAREYEDMKETFRLGGKDTSEVWVYHGTNDSNIHKIMSGGFKIGGIDVGIKVLNGSSYGLGVYTSRRPSLPMTYCKGIGKLILSKGLTGLKSGMTDTRADSWEGQPPYNDVIVFKSGKQLLPVYVLHYD